MDLCCEPKPMNKAEMQANEDGHCLIRFEEQKKRVSQITKDKARFKAALAQVRKISKQYEQYDKEEIERMKAKKSGIATLLSRAKRL